MLYANDGARAVRFSNPDSLDKYLAGGRPACTPVSAQSSIEEVFFLGLRLNRGLDLEAMARELGVEPVAAYSGKISELTDAGLLVHERGRIRLTERGRLLSNEVFEQFISAGSV
jgi:oxygen-independent coproporphyrinogen-3 oxidase